MKPESSLPQSQEPATPRPMCMISNKKFYGEELLAPLPTRKLKDHPLSTVRDCLFNIFAATLHIWKPLVNTQPEDTPCHLSQPAWKLWKS
jgi:hypothetical protein